MKESNIERIAICPKCGNAYHGYPALSRIDNTTLICPDCCSKSRNSTFYLAVVEYNRVCLVACQTAFKVVIAYCCKEVRRYMYSIELNSETVSNYLIYLIPCETFVRGYMVSLSYSVYISYKSAVSLCEVAVVSDSP